jgi:hypothetical protein
MAVERDELKSRLAAGESLEISTGGGDYEVWVERYANPPTLFYEGQAMPFDALDTVVGAILHALEQGDVTCRWVEPRGMQVKSCEKHYRLRAAGMLE